MLAVLLSGCQQFTTILLVLKPGKIGIVCQSYTKEMVFHSYRTYTFRILSYTYTQLNRVKTVFCHKLRYVPEQILILKPRYTESSIKHSKKIMFPVITA